MFVKGKMYIIIDLYIIIDCNYNYEVIFVDEMYGYIEIKLIFVSWNIFLVLVLILLMIVLVKLIFLIIVKYFMNRL